MQNVAGTLVKPKGITRKSKAPISGDTSSLCLVALLDSDLIVA